MVSHRVAAVFAMALAASVGASAQNPPNESNCRMAIEEMRRTMKAVPHNSERDRERNKALTERVEKLIADNRSRGVSECQTWGEMNKIFSSQ